jgi:hypothetical protein
MVYSNLGKKSLSMMIAMAFAISGCLPSDIPSSRQQLNEAAPYGESNSGVGAGATTSGSTSGVTTLPPKVEIRHLIEPNFSTNPNYSSGTGYAGGGSYVRKLTLPKNYQGMLYLAGINIGTLANKHVKVRFKFGLARDPVTVDATVSQAPGITPQTNIGVLVMNLKSEPFRAIRLPYDLYDYNEYPSSASALPDSPTPVQDNRDTGLFCRGLKLEDDPTFTGVGQCDGAQPDEECLYAYAKVLDQGLVKEDNTVSPVTYLPETPNLSQSKSVVGPSYYQDSMAQALRKPLLDNFLGPFKFSELAVPLNSSDSINLDFLLSSTPFILDWNAKSINSVNYYYRGPYRLINRTNWEFKFSDPVGNKKLFKNSRPYTGPAIAAPEDNTVYFGSYLFPIATKLKLNAGVYHLSSSEWDGVRSETNLAVPGDTLWMDGSNARANSKNVMQEHVGSCNVTSSIEIIAKDNNGNDYVIALAKDVKFQLVRPIQYYSDTGKDVLSSNFKTCTSNAACGSSECCFNNRCWDQSLVSQCFDSSLSNQGSGQIGETCSTDLECGSLCCGGGGKCTPHNTILNPAVLCNKPIGTFCIAKEWCQKSPVVTCIVVDTGTDALGNATCRQQCYTTSEYGDCRNGICSSPFQPTIPVFDPNDPNACNNAVPAPRF